MSESQEVDVYEYEGYKKVSHPDSGITIAIDPHTQSVKLEAKNGSYVYFRSHQDLLALRAIVDKIIALNAEFEKWSYHP